MNKKYYIHYGSEHFDKEKFKPIKIQKIDIPTVIFNKPNGGYWASRSDAKYGWKAFCITNDLYNMDVMPYTVFALKNSAKIYAIDSLKDLDWLVEYGLAQTFFECPKVYQIDFEKMMNRHDAIELNMSNDYNNLYRPMYDWDCDSILIMNPDIIEEVDA